MNILRNILDNGTTAEKKALFCFDSTDEDKKVVLKYNLWTRHFFPKYFTSPDAAFHEQIDLYNLQTYRGTFTSFVDIAFRGAAKTARTKLFIAYCIANDLEHTRKFYKVLSEDGTNSKQIVTDIYNHLIMPRVARMYPELFKKTNKKREETMSSFTTSTGIKIASGTVGTDQRGALQEEARPDVIWYEDFENRKTLRSGVKTKAIWDNMEEARTGLSKDGVCIYTCNYISEAGNVHKLVTKRSDNKKLLIVPIIKDGNLAWPERYTHADIEQMKQDDDDFEGERLCQPSASAEILFDRERLDKMDEREPERVTGGFKIFREFNPSHRYGSGHDVAGGVGLDSSTSVFIDFDTVPAQVVATYKDNTIKPEIFGDEIYRQQGLYGHCISGVERNYGTEAILRLKQLGANLYAMPKSDTKKEENEPTEYGWHTNLLTKPKMISAMRKAIEDGLIELNDPDLIAEFKSYSRNDLMDNVKDPRLTTRHFDLLIAACIAWQMKDFTIVFTHKKQKIRSTMTKYG